MKRATIAYYDPPRRPPAGERPDFTALPLTGRAVNVCSMRAAGGGFCLDREGFAVADAPTSVRDFFDRDEVAGRYVPEARALVRALTGCASTALLNSPVVRVSGRAGPRPAGATFTGDFAHADFSAPAAESMLRRNLPAAEAAERLRHRYAVFNVWRAFSGPPQDVPLALCDTRSVAPQDKQYCLITMKSAAGDLMTWENIAYYHNEAHRWWYCPDMTRDEAYVFRSFDSSPDHAEQVPHSAFVNESCPASAPPRASIEVRVFAFYE
ncbi:MAG TPA: CmcJ/NvfI family oxidoreductase [Trebonia sp.]